MPEDGKSNDSDDERGPGGGWEGTYAATDELPWDTGEPQPVVEALASEDAFASPVLDVGCGIGTNACYLASEGYDVVGVDVSPTAVERARDRAAERGLDVEFAAGDAFELGTPTGVVGENWARSVLDVGVFHALEPDRRGAYADALARVLELGGHAFVLSFAPGAPEDWPPHLISRDDVRDAFALDDPDSDWRIVEFRDATYVSRGGEVPALLSILERKQ